MHVWAGEFGDFVAGAPGDDGGVIAIAEDEIARVLFMPVVPENVVAVGLAVFLEFPDIEEFVDDEDAHAVAEGEEFRGRWVVGSADGVAAHFLENFDLALHGAGVHGASEWSEIMVIADTLQDDFAAIE